MTTDGTSSTPEPPRPPSAAFNPDEDYPDLRDDRQREDDQGGAAEQSAALTDDGPDPHAYVNEMIERILQGRRDIAGIQMENPPIQFDVWRDPEQRDPDMGIVILVARGEMLLRVPAGGPPGPGGAPGPDEAAGTGGDERSREILPTWQQADGMLRERHYEQISDDFPMGLPLRRYRAADKNADQLVQDRNEIRNATGAEVDLNYVVTAGHLVKADDYPRLTAARRCYPPEWIRCHKVAREINVAVIDTGINHLRRTDGWLTGIPEDDTNIDPLNVFPVTVQNGQVIRGDDRLDLSAGHGTFVAAVVEQVAPESTIRVYRAVDTEGMGTSDNVANAIIQAAEDGADIINLSLGTRTVDNLPPLAFTTAVDMVKNPRPDLVIVASAGNTGLDVPMFPAAMPGVVSVGALNADLTPAIWSNHGFWLTCSAVGVGITSPFVPGDEPPHPNDAVPIQHFEPDDWALWSGTSFSAPQIAGAVAELCQLNDVSPPVALGQLLDARRVLPGYGNVVPILPGS